MVKMFTKHVWVLSPTVLNGSMVICVDVLQKLIDTSVLLLELLICICVIHASSNEFQSY